MGILGRINSVIQSNLNELVDRMSDPAKEIELLVTEMEEAEDKARQELLSAVAEVKLTEKRRDELHAEVARWQQRAEQAVRNGDDALAREALGEKARLQRLAGDAGAVLAEQQQYADNLRRSIKEFEAKMEQLKARKGTLAQQARAARQGAGLGQSPAMAELDRITGRIDAMEAEVELTDSLDGRDAATEARFQALEQKSPDPAVEDALAELKRKMETP